jgi:hypothetical protein
MSKNLFPEGVRVMAVQGVPMRVDPNANTQNTVDPVVGHIPFTKPRILVFPISNHMAGGDLLVVSLLVRGDGSHAEGFTSVSIDVAHITAFIHLFWLLDVICDVVQ